jgi:hypothetical protein
MTRPRPGGAARAIRLDLSYAAIGDEIDAR